MTLCLISSVLALWFLTGRKRKSAMRKGPTGYDYPDSIQFHTALGSFSALMGPAPLARLEIVFAVFDYQAAVRSFAAVSNRRLLRYHKYSDEIPCLQTLIYINCPFNSPIFFCRSWYNTLFNQRRTVLGPQRGIRASTTPPVYIFKGKRL